MFVGQETPYGIIKAAGINPAFTGSKRDKVYFAFFGGDGYILRQAFNVMWHMQQENDPRVEIWDRWLTSQFGPLTFTEEFDVEDTNAAADDEQSGAMEKKSAAAVKWVQRALL